jgi:hypothetical protein
MGKILISQEILRKKIGELEKQLYSSHSDANNIATNSKIEILNWIINDFNQPDITEVTFKELRVKYLSNSRDTMSRWMENYYPDGLIIKRDDKP